MTDKKSSLVTIKDKKEKEDTPFERFLKETDSKLRKNEKHTWMIQDHEHLNQNE